jgi:4-amino-4-deoxy-L-arabinose transferase-like glycosyltransferase/Tfp pilus assembly protein PilF
MSELAAERTPPARRWDRIVWIAVAVTLVFRLLYYLQIRHNPFFDTPLVDEEYHEQWARDWAAGHWALRIPFFRAPLYQFVLSLFYRIPGEPHYALVRGFQLAIGAVTPALVWGIGRRLMPERRRAAAIAAFVVGLDGMLFKWEADLLLESLLAAMSTLLILLILRAGETGRPRRWFAAGLAMGLFAITRPNVLLCAPLVFVLALGWEGASFALRRWRWKSGLALTLGTCLLVLPMTFINWKVGGDRVLVASQAGVNFYIGNNSTSNGWGAAAPGFLGNTIVDAQVLAEKATGRTMLPSEIDDYWYARGFAFWREHPSDALLLTAKKIVLLLSGLELPNNTDVGLFMHEFAAPFVPCLYLLYVITPLALVGAYAGWRRGAPGPRAVILFMVIYSFTIFMFFVADRYRVPLRPLLAIFAVEGGYRIYEGLRTRTLRGVMPAAAALVLGLSINCNPWVSENRRSAPAFYDTVASIYRTKGEPEKAIYYQERVRAMLGDHYPGLNRQLALIYSEAGHVPEAIAAFERERAIDPGNRETLEGLADVLLQNHQADAAVQLFQQTEAAGFDSAQILLDHAQVLARVGRSADTVEAMYRRVVEKDPRYAQGWNQLALLKARTGHPEEAIHMWETAAELAPDLPDVDLNIDRARRDLAAKAAADSPDAGVGPSSPVPGP